MTTLSPTSVLQKRKRDPDESFRNENKYDRQPEEKRSKHRDSAREDRRERSRSRDRYERRKERSRSRERDRRDRDRDRDRERDRDRDRRREDRFTDRDRDRDRDYRDAKSDRYRSRSRERHAPRRDHASRSERDRHHDRSRSPIRNGTTAPPRTRSPPKGPRSDHNRHRDLTSNRPDSKPIKKEPTVDGKSVTREPVIDGETRPTTNGTNHVEDEDEDDAFLRRTMGFTSFKTTQNTKVPGNQIYGVRKEKKAQYRQYMNRMGGFNRPLSPTR